MLLHNQLAVRVHRLATLKHYGSLDGHFDFFILYEVLWIVRMNVFETNTLSV